MPAQGSARHPAPTRESLEDLARVEQGLQSLPGACRNLFAWVFQLRFLLLRARSVGFAVRDIALLYALFNAAFVVSAPPIGRLGDRWGRGAIITAGYLTYLFISRGFAWAAAKWQIVVLFVLYGLFCSIDEAQSKAFIADVEPERRASAIGVYNFLTGLLYVLASVMAGALWPSILRAPSFLRRDFRQPPWLRSPSCARMCIVLRRPSPNECAWVPRKRPAFTGDLRAAASPCCSTCLADSIPNQEAAPCGVMMT